MATLKLTSDALAGQTGLKVWVYSDPSSVVNAGGTTLTPGIEGSFSCSIDLPVGAYTCKIKNGNTVVATGGEIFVNDVASDLIVDDPTQRAIFYAQNAKNLESLKVSIDDTRDQEFVWPLAGEVGLSTISGSPAFPTRKRRFIGSATLANLSGAITYLGLFDGEHKWKWAYNVADRARDGVTVVEDRVEITLTDKNGNKGRMTLNIVSGGSNSGEITILPGALTQNVRNTEDSITLYVGETVTTSRQVLDANKNPVTLTGRTLKFYLDDASRKRLGSYDPTVSGSTFTVTVTGITDLERIAEFGLWDETSPSNKFLLAKGKVKIEYAAGPLSPT